MTPVEAFVRARGLGITFRLDEAGDVFASLPGTMTEPPVWLAEAKQSEPDGMAFAVALGSALERSGCDAGALLGVNALVLGVTN